MYLYFRQQAETCKRTGCYRVFLFGGLGIFSTIWFLVRVIPPGHFIIRNGVKWVYKVSVY